MWGNSTCSAWLIASPPLYLGVHLVKPIHLWYLHQRQSHPRKINPGGTLKDRAFTYRTRWFQHTAVGGPQPEDPGGDGLEAPVVPGKQTWGFVTWFFPTLKVQFYRSWHLFYLQMDFINFPDFEYEFGSLLTREDLPG